MPAPPFLRLQDVVLPAPLPAIVSVLIVAAFAQLGTLVARRLRRDRTEALDIAAGFVTVTAIAAASVHAMALAQLTSVRTLRPLGLGLAVIGAIAIWRHRARIAAIVRHEAAAIGQASRLDRAAAVLVALTILAFGLAALGPPTDADSIDYHLGLPLEWLRHGGAFPRLDWFPSRLAGITESVNMLGLAAGTDSLGAGLQFGGMIAAGVALCSFAATPRDRLFVWLLVVACPTMGFLVPNQKPQLLPTAGTTIAIVIAVQRFADFRREDAILALTAALFAVASKASFVLSAGFAVVVCLAAGRASRRTAFVAAATAAIFALLPLPPLLRNLAFYGDPLSPLLERFRAHPDPEVTAFAAYLKTMAGALTVHNLVRLPLDMVVNVQPAAFTTVLGIGSLAFVVALPAQGRTRLLLWAALGAAALYVLLGQLAPRFFLEPFLWAGAAAVAARWTLRKRLLLRGLTVQAVGAALFALVGAVSLFPGAITPRWRHAVLTRAAAGFTEAEWLDEVLPPDAIFVTKSRFHLFSPRPFVTADPVTSAAGARADENLLKLVIDHKATHLVVYDTTEAFARLNLRCGHLVAGPTEFKLASRNLFNKLTYEARLFRLDACGTL